MRYVPDSPLQLAHRVWPVRPPKPSMTVVVKGTFDVVPDGPARFAAEPLPPTGELYVDDDVARPLRAPNDLALLKPVGEAMIVGSAWAPGAKPASSVVCELAVGPIHKRFAVFGDRHWAGWGVFKEFSPPAPFRSMPLTMERAWGYPGFEANPYGVGREPVKREDGSEMVPLPNLEHPTELVDSVNGGFEPVIVGPIPVTSARRLRHAGTYDGRYLRERWPYFPEDFRWEFFQEAPEDQRLREGYFRGDEPFRLQGLHPEHGVVEGRLPGVLPRACVDLDRGGVASFEEVPLRLDTVVWDGDQAKLLLVWRGLIEVPSEHLDEVRHVYITHQWLQDPIVHIDRLRARMQDVLQAEEQEEEDAEGEPPPPPDAPVEAEAAPEDEAPEDEAPDPEAEALAAEEAAREAEIEARLAAAGVVPPPAPPAERTPPDPRALLAAMVAAGITVSPEMEAALLETVEPEAEVAEAPEEEPPPVPTPDPEGRAMVEARMAAGEDLQHLDLSGLDLSGMDLSGQDLSYSMLGEAKLVATRLDGATLYGTNLVEANLTGATLTNADLTNADLTDALAGGASFHGARLEDAFLDGADLEGAILTNAAAPRASFLGAKLTRASLAGADLEQADLGEAVLDHADATGARLGEATLEGASAASARFVGAKLTGLRAEGLRASEADFSGVDAAESHWERATLTRADFTKSVLSRADFTEAVLISAELDRCALEAARFDRANAHSMKAQRSNLMEACFESCDLSFADLRGSNLYGAELWRANTDSTELELADLGRTKLER
ncbi:MAG: DUF2169 domain-containing protein [Sandaracinaceae bacterium]|nr:DUF2169 domain-containing protein [Sandaracinaceae bacterium]